MRYAVLFTAYFWDDFVARQYAQIKARAKNHDLFVMVDETAGPLGKIPVANLIRTSQREIHSRCGLPPIVPDNVKHLNPLWWNLDYLTYRFFQEHPQYDYCLTLDYDTRVNLDIDKLFVNVAAGGYDFVAKPIANDLSDWDYRQMHAPIYPLTELRANLLGAMVVSRQAAQYLVRQRRDFAAAYQMGDLSFWPFCEAFMPVELARARFKIADLSQFGATERFGWHRAWCERDRGNVAAPGFVHPVVDQNRFIPIFLRRHKPAKDIFDFRSPVWAELRKYPIKLYLQPVIIHMARFAVTPAWRAAKRWRLPEKFLAAETVLKIVLTKSATIIKAALRQLKKRVMPAQAGIHFVAGKMDSRQPLKRLRE